ncbi:hypothetical protein OFEAOIEE_LOCUS3742 [Methylorubrum extorquens]
MDVNAVSGRPSTEHVRDDHVCRLVVCNLLVVSHAFT